MSRTVLRTPVPTTQVDGFSISSLRTLEHVTDSPAAQPHLEKVSIQIDIHYDGSNPHLGEADGWSCFCTRQTTDAHFQIDSSVPVIIISKHSVLTTITVEDTVYEKQKGVWLRLDTFDENDNKAAAVLHLIRPYQNTLH